MNCKCSWTTIDKDRKKRIFNNNIFLIFGVRSHCESVFLLYMLITSQTWFIQEDYCLLFFSRCDCVWGWVHFSDWIFVLLNHNKQMWIFKRIHCCFIWFTIQKSICISMNLWQTRVYCALLLFFYLVTIVIIVCFLLKCCYKRSLKLDELST